MKPLTGFEVLRPRTLVGALEILATTERTQPIAGGTDLIPTIKDLGTTSRFLVDLGLIPELKGVSEEGGYTRIGSTTSIAQLLTSAQIALWNPALHDAAKLIGSVQIRNRGTIGGNLCNASPASDAAPPLLVHDAEVLISSLNGSRCIPLQELFAGPKLTYLNHGELLTGIRFRNVEGAKSSFKRIGRRKSFTLSVVNAAVYIERRNKTITKIRLAAGSVAPTPIRLFAIEDEIRGREMTENLLEEAGYKASESVSPIDDVRGTSEYRKDMTAVLIRQAIFEAWRRTGGK